VGVLLSAGTALAAWRLNRRPEEGNQGEQYWAEQFSSEVDGLLNEVAQTPTATAPAEYVEALDMARQLAAVDFSPESRQRQIARRRLLMPGALNERKPSTKEVITKALYVRPVMLKALGAALAVLLLVSLLFPSSVVAAGQVLQHVVYEIAIGAYTTVARAEAWVKGEPPPLRPDEWTVKTDIGAYGGNAPPGVDATVRSFATLEEAQAVAAFDIAVPADLPEGYVIREINVAPMDQVFLFYGGPGHDVIVIESWVGPRPSDDPNVAVGVYSGYVTNGTLEETDLDGRRAAWANGNTLIWEVDSISFQVGGLDLTLEQAKQIARSLR
jgi:hypothetical protein